MLELITMIAFAILMFTICVFIVAVAIRWIIKAFKE